MNNLIPGLEHLFEEEEEEEFFNEGATGKGYFDATQLPDASGRQRNANGNQTYVLHIVFPSQEEMKRALFVLTNGQRKGLAAKVKEGSLNGIAIRKEDGKTWLEYWESMLLDAEKPKTKRVCKPKKHDEAEAPVE